MAGLLGEPPLGGVFPAAFAGSLYEGQQREIILVRTLVRELLLPFIHKIFTYAFAFLCGAGPAIRSDLGVGCTLYPKLCVMYNLKRK